MTFTYPSIQSFVGAHSGTGANAAAVDWARTEVYELNNTYISRYGFLSGLEEAWNPLADLNGSGNDGVSAYVGLGANGNLMISASNSLYAGAAMGVNALTLTGTNFIAYPAPNFGQGGMAGVTKGSTQYFIDKGLGDNIISVLNRINSVNQTTWLAQQDYAGVGGKCCAGVAGAGIAYVLSPAQTGPTQVGPITLSKIAFDGFGAVTNTVVGTITMASIDVAWTDQFGVSGVCLDQTDSKLLAVITGVAGAERAYLVKVDPATAAVVWKVAIPRTNGGGPVVVGNTFAQSDIQSQRVGFLTGSPAQVTIYNTATGAIDHQYSTGVGGMHPANDQAYSDVLGCIFLSTDYTAGAGAPTQLNSTPSSYSNGWSALYVADGITPPPGPGTPGGPATSRKRSWTFTLDGHEFYVLDLGPEGTWCYDKSTQTWMNFYTLDYVQWDVCNGVMWGNRIVGGDLATTDIWECAASTQTDNGLYNIPHKVTGGLQTRSRASVGCAAVLLSASLGDLYDVTGSSMQMRYSDDGGNTFTAYDPIAMTQGDFNTELRWRSLGSFAYPGRTFQFYDEGGPRAIYGCDAFLNDFDNEKQPDLTEQQ